MQLVGRNLSTGTAFPVEAFSHLEGLTINDVTLHADPSSPRAIVKLHLLSRLGNIPLSNPVALSAEVQVHVLDPFTGRSVYPRFYSDWTLSSWAEIPRELDLGTPMSAIYFASPVSMSVVISAP